jgi:NTE family protein
MTAPRTLGEWLEEAPFALGLSSGFFGFFAHCGMLMALEEAGLRPARLAGSSAGALVASIWAAGLDGPQMAAELRSLRRADFWDPGPGPGLLRGRLFRRRLEATLPVAGFNRCRVPVAVSVHDLIRRRTEILDTGDLAAAVHASCAVPLLFQPVRIGGRVLVDGGVSDRPGIAGLPPGGRILFHHLASRSPWRFAVPMPKRSDLVTLVLDGLPRCGPFRLEAGPRALEEARERTSRALSRPLSSLVRG